MYKYIFKMFLNFGNNININRILFILYLIKWAWIIYFNNEEKKNKINTIHLYNDSESIKKKKKKMKNGE